MSRNSRQKKSIDDLQSRFAPLKGNITSTHGSAADPTSSKTSKTFSIADVTADEFVHALQHVVKHDLVKRLRRACLTGRARLARATSATDARRAQAKAIERLVLSIEQCALAYAQTGQLQREYRNTSGDIAKAIKYGRPPCADCGRIIHDHWTRWDVVSSVEDQIEHTNHRPVTGGCKRVCYRCSRQYEYRVYVGKQRDDGVVQFWQV